MRDGETCVQLAPTQHEADIDLTCGTVTGAPADSFPDGLNALPTTGQNAVPVEGARSKRKQTLLSLLDMLNELSKDHDLGEYALHSTR